MQNGSWIIYTKWKTVAMLLSSVYTSLGAVRVGCSIMTKTRTARSLVASGNTSPVDTWRTFILFYHKILKQYKVKKKKKKNNGTSNSPFTCGLRRVRLIISTPDCIYVSEAIRALFLKAWPVRIRAPPGKAEILSQTLVEWTEGLCSEFTDGVRLKVLGFWLGTQYPANEGRCHVLIGVSLQVSVQFQHLWVLT